MHRKWCTGRRDIEREKEGRGEGVSGGQERTLGGDEMYAKRVLQIELPQVVR